MPQLLFEIGVEELPALSIEPAADFLKEDIAKRLEKLRLAHSLVKTFGTPRRLVVMVEDLVLKQDDITEELLGPQVAMAYDQDQKLTKAALGFIASKGVKESDIFRKQTDKGEVIAARKVEKGRFTKELLPTLLTEAMRAIPFKKKMRWESSGELFSRPVRWLLCLFDGEHVPLKFADVVSGNTSRGHRFINNDPFLVTSSSQYLDELKNRFVMLSSAERERAFVESAQEKLLKLSACFDVDPDLMATVRNLFEYPFVILGSFERDYLKIPREILICEMKNHQKCFAVYNKAGEMLPNFVCSAATKPYDEEVFASGNARVLRARFEDGAFYFKEDRKKTLRQHAESLSNLIFERELGTVKDKCVRIESASLDLARAFSLSQEDQDVIKGASPIIKADLVTGVVGQFPELQGVMGRIYAEADGEDKRVALAIETHYWPRFADDKLPPCRASALLSLADRLDTLVGIIGIGKKPTGNKDPFALRRAAIGIVRILLYFGFSIDVRDLIKVALKSYGEQFRMEASSVANEVLDFVLQRARSILIDDLAKENKDNAVNFTDSALATGACDMVDVFARAHTLHTMCAKNKAEFESLVQAFKRAGNIVKKAEGAGEKYKLSLHHIQYLVLPYEIELLQAIEQAKNVIEKSFDKTDVAALRATYVDAFAQVALLKPKLDNFFDNVMVMVDDKNVREARLALLSEIKSLADRIADFTHL